MVLYRRGLEAWLKGDRKGERHEAIGRRIQAEKQLLQLCHNLLLRPTNSTSSSLQSSTYNSCRRVRELLKIGPRIWLWNCDRLVARTRTAIGMPQSLQKGSWYFLMPTKSSDPERAFSAAKTTLSDRRNRLGIHMIEYLECLRSWSGQTEWKHEVKHAKVIKNTGLKGPLVEEAVGQQIEAHL